MEGGTLNTNIFDQEEIHYDCTVQILSNSITGEESIGWWENEGWHRIDRNNIPEGTVVAFSKENNQQMIGIVYWDEDCDCFICDYEGILMFDVTHWRNQFMPPEDGK